MDRLTYQRVADADEINDAIVVRIRRLDGHLLGEADHPTLEDAQTQQLIVAALGNPVSVEKALSEAQRMRDQLPFENICIEIEDDADWKSEWGTLLPIKLSTLQAKPFR